MTREITQLEVRRKAMGVSRQALAEIAGVSAVTIWRVENRKHPPRNSTLVCLMRALVLFEGGAVPLKQPIPGERKRHVRRTIHRP